VVESADALATEAGRLALATKIARHEVVIELKGALRRQAQEHQNQPR
jgi:hypothetical protein